MATDKTDVKVGTAHLMYDVAATLKTRWPTHFAVFAAMATRVGDAMIDEAHVGLRNEPP